MKKLLVFMGIFAFILPLMFLGCADDGSDGAQGIQGPPGPPGAGAAAQPESCSVCHDDTNFRNGDSHQADYDQRFRDGFNGDGVLVSNVAYANDGVNDTVTFDMTKLGVDFDCTQLTATEGDSLGIYFTTYTGTSFEQAARISLSGTGSTTTYNGAGQCQVTKPQSALGDLALINGLIVIYGRDDRLGTLPSPSRVQLAVFPFGNVYETGPAGVDYVSAATVTGCEKCHTVPFLKHGYEYGRVNNDPATDFYLCKGCHLDNGDGGHFIWQLLVNDPRLIITLEEEFGEDWEELAAADARLAPYQYRTRLMNDVHMSHAMEFAYPQSMANCTTCHEGKLASVLTDANFVVETCKSCHPVTAASYPDKSYVDSHRAPALVGLLPIPGSISAHNPPFTVACNGCHQDPATGGFAPVFSELHTGYDQVIYSGNSGTKYSSAITVSIDSASFDPATNQLTFSFSAAGSLGTADSANINPSVLVGLYGFNTKDFLQGPHESEPTGLTNAGGQSLRALEWELGGTRNSPYITVAGGDVTVDLSYWAALIAADNVVRVELAVLPSLENGDGVEVALDAPSRTFNLVDNDFEDDFFGNSIVKAAGCNTCHEALATTFHSPDRGGNVVVCRLCHITKVGGSHLELQSRSIDSYAHAIHRFQIFDIGDIDFTDPVEAMEFTHHVQSNFPRFGIEDCLSCHNAGKFNVPDQSKSLPGVLSSADVVTTRNIGTVPSFITGPATRACGACHRAEAIIANAGAGDPNKLASINSHMRTFGYLVEVPVGATSAETSALRDAKLLEVIDEIFSAL